MTRSLHLPLRTRVLVALFIAVSAHADAADTSPEAVRQLSNGEYDFSTPVGPNHRLITAPNLAPNLDPAAPKGATSSYVLVGTGINYLENGEWRESSQEIIPSPEGASAVSGPLKLHLRRNLNSPSAVTLIHPDGARQVSRPQGLYYVDRTDGAWVRLAELKDSIGSIVSSNRVVYRDFLDGIRADYQVWYRAGTVEIDVILREQPPSPGEFGLDESTTVLEMVTVFEESPEPVLRKAQLHATKDPVRRAQLLEPDLQDDGPGFSSAQMILGTAFRLSTQGGKPEDPTQEVPIAKLWETLGVEHVLRERMPYGSVKTHFEHLPVRTDKTAARLTRTPRAWPSTLAASEGDAPMSIAAFEHEPGFAIDYITLAGSTSNYTFYAGITYLIPNEFTILQESHCTFQGQAILKFGNAGRFTLFGTFSGGGAVLTSANDPSVGDNATVVGPIANRSIGLYIYNWTYSSTNLSLSSMDIRHAGTAVLVYSTLGNTYTFEAPKFRSVSTGVDRPEGVSPSLNAATVNVSNPCLYATANLAAGSVYVTGSPSACENTPPGVSSMPTIVTLMNHPSTPVPFWIYDLETPPESLVVTIESGGGLQWGSFEVYVSGTGFQRTLQIVPDTGAFGSGQVELRVSDGEYHSSAYFMIEVVSDDHPPVVFPMADMTVPAGETGHFSVHVSDVVDGPDQLQLSVVSFTA